MGTGLGRTWTKERVGPRKGVQYDSLTTTVGRDSNRRRSKRLCTGCGTGPVRSCRPSSVHGGGYEGGQMKGCSNDRN